MNAPSDNGPTFTRTIMPPPNPGRAPREKRDDSAGEKPNIFIFHRQADTFARIPHALTEDPDLTMKAKGILAYLLGKPPGWRMYVSDLVKHCRDGEAAIRSGLNELRAAGYAQLAKIKDERGRIIRWEWRIADSRYFPVQTPDGCFGELESDGLGNRDYSKKKGSKNNSNKNHIAPPAASLMTKQKSMKIPARLKRLSVAPPASASEPRVQSVHSDPASLDAERARLETDAAASLAATAERRTARKHRLTPEGVSKMWFDSFHAAFPGERPTAVTGIEALALAKKLRGTFKDDGAAAEAFLQWCVASWSIIRAQHFHWAVSPPAPLLPSIRFLSGKGVFPRFHEAWADQRWQHELAGKSSREHDVARLVRTKGMTQAAAEREVDKRSSINTEAAALRAERQQLANDRLTQQAADERNAYWKAKAEEKKRQQAQVLPGSSWDDMDQQPTTH